MGLGQIYIQSNLLDLFRRSSTTHPSYFLLFFHDDLLLLPFSCHH